MEAVVGAIITGICDAHLGIPDTRVQETSDATVHATKLFSDIATGGNNYVAEFVDLLF